MRSTYKDNRERKIFYGKIKKGNFLFVRLGQSIEWGGTYRNLIYT